MRLGLPRPGPGRVVALTTATALVTGATGWLVGAQVRSPADAAAAHRPPPASLITVEVQRRQLTATVTAQGTVAYGVPQPLTLTGSVAAADDGAAATPLITKAPVAGRTLREGDVLLEVSGRPVFVLTGKVPMYRNLTSGSTGDDVRQLRAALRRLLPHRGVARSGPLDTAALNAVAAWYDKRGYAANRPSREQRAELRRLEQAVDATEATPGPALTDARAALAEFRATYGISIAGGEILFLPKLPVLLTKVTAKAGGPASGQIGTVADPTLVINGDVAADDAGLIRVGMAATMEHPSGRAFPVTISAMGAGATPAPPAVTADDQEDKDDSARNTEAPGVPIRFTPKSQAKLRPFAGQSMKITIKVGDTGDPVLSVPVAAIFTASNGQARVSVQDGTGAVHDVAVRAGLTTDGYAQVTPAEAGALEPGDRVVVGSR